MLNIKRNEAAYHFQVEDSKTWRMDARTSLTASEWHCDLVAASAFKRGMNFLKAVTRRKIATTNLQEKIVNRQSQGTQKVSNTEFTNVMINMFLFIYTNIFVSHLFFLCLELSVLLAFLMWIISNITSNQNKAYLIRCSTILSI